MNFQASVSAPALYLHLQQLHRHRSVGDVLLRKQVQLCEFLYLVHGGRTVWPRDISQVQLRYLAVWQDHHATQFGRRLDR